MSENNPDNTPHEPSRDELREMLEKFLSGQGDVDPSRLANAAGFSADPAAIAGLMQQLQNAMNSTNDSIDWSPAAQQAKAITEKSSSPVTAEQRTALESAVHIAGMWLDETTSISALASEPRLITRSQWAEETMPVWTELAEPVALNIADALTGVLQQQAPEEMSDLVKNAGKLMRNLGGTLFAAQLGQVTAQLASEVVSGGDVGIPLMPDGGAALVPQNIDSFGEGLDVPADQIALYLAVRELAHARLFRHAKWLRLYVISSITESTRGIEVDTERMETLAENFDPSNPEALKDAVSRGDLLLPRSNSQNQALVRLETTLALIEGWVDVVTAAATVRLPSRDAIIETVRRRRATGGPAERAFSTLIGLELRPRRLREAAALWQSITDSAGAEKRDELWSHPDLVPTSSDIDDPSGFLARLSAPPAAPDEMDQALEDLLRGDNPEQ